MSLFKKSGFDSAAADAALVGFWGKSNGGFGAMTECEQGVRDAKPTEKNLYALRAGLNTCVQGTTGDRIRRVDRMLKRLIHEQAK